VYVVAPPRIGDGLAFLRDWAHPKKGRAYPNVLPAQPTDILDYVAAFYRGLPVKLLTSNIQFLPWDSDKASSKTVPKYVGLAVSDECIRIRTRACPDKVYAHQLNLDDLLDAAISVLPEDAYALCMLVDHDLYEDDDDVFVCGRAYGGSRVAVVSSARYHPGLDKVHSVERDHAWPASHCQEYINGCCNAAPVAKRQRTTPSRTPTPSERLKVSVAAASAVPDIDSSLDLLSALWLSRMCRTVSHELGHCFGIDHCVYYACSMQGSASLAEDARQPPYLCPVDLAKVLYATGTTAAERNRALVEYCNRAGNRGSQLFAALAAWCLS
jgi:archaemetzincin